MEPFVGHVIQIAFKKGAKEGKNDYFLSFNQQLLQMFFLSNVWAGKLAWFIQALCIIYSEENDVNQ